MLNIACKHTGEGAKGARVQVGRATPNAGLARGMQTRKGERKISARKGQATKAAKAANRAARAKAERKAAGLAAGRRLGERLRDQ